MATPTMVEKVIDQAENADATVSLAAGTQATDLLVCFHLADFYSAALLVAPTGTSTGTWTLHATGDAGLNDVKVKVWTKPAIAGAQTVVCNQVFDACNWAIVYVLRNVAASPVESAAGNQGATDTTSHVAPSVTPTSTDALLLCASLAGQLSNYTAPGSMTEDFDSDCAAQSTCTSAFEALVAAGATGTRTFTSSTSSHFAAASIVIGGELTSGRPLILAPPYAARRAASW